MERINLAKERFGEYVKSIEETIKFEDIGYEITEKAHTMAIIFAAIMKLAEEKLSDEEVGFIEESLKEIIRLEKELALLSLVNKMQEEEDVNE